MLLYCMTEAETAVDRLPPGVGEAPVEALAAGGVLCFYSRVQNLTASAEGFRADALRFHAVVRAILDRAAVVPFRFPALLETDLEIREFLASHAPAYLQDLRRLRGLVQMEVRIKAEDAFPEPQSGKEYMDARAAETRALQAHADAVVAAAGGLIAEWQARREACGLRGYALVRREQVAAFEQRVRALSPVQGASIMVSGPWPPSEFLHVGNP